MTFNIIIMPQNSQHFFITNFIFSKPHKYSHIEAWGYPDHRFQALDTWAGFDLCGLAAV